MDTPSVPPPYLLLTTLEGDALRQLQVSRLERLLRLRRQHELELNRQGLRLLDRAVFAAYCECRDHGTDGEARRLLRQARLEEARSTARRQQAPVPQPSAPGARPEA